MALTPTESSMLDEIARRTAAADPHYARRLSAFGGYETSVLGLPSRWTLLPVALVGLVLALGVVVAGVVAVRDAGATTQGAKTVQPRNGGGGVQNP